MIRRKSKIITLFVILISISLNLMFLSKAHATSFNSSDIIDDGVFNNTSTMSISQINSFLNQFSGSCISTNNGFSAPDPTGYNPAQGFTYGGNVSAGQVIYDASLAYGLNPQVIITTIQKEQSLVTGGGANGCTANAYAAAAGYGCPDNVQSYNYVGVNIGTVNGQLISSVNETCVNSSSAVGFSEQVIRASWLLAFGEQRSQGNINWDVQATNYPQQGDSWNNSDDPQTCYGGPMTQGTWQVCPNSSSTYYDGYATISNTSVYIDNGATAALYWYTPHFSGNQKFDNIFTSWFGSLYTTNYYDSPYSQSGTQTLNPGQSSTVFIEYQNLGSQAWYDNNSLSSAPSGTYPVHLSTDNPVNSSSPFSSTWPQNNRAAYNFAAVYESNGTTLASNQNVVEPGQVAVFSFTISIPNNLSPGSYRAYFVPILEGTYESFNDFGSYILVVVNSVPALSYVSQSPYPTIAAGTSEGAYLEMQNTGNTPLYDDASLSNAPSGTYPVHLATTNPINSSSSFSSTWPQNNRLAYNFAAVYESDGTTLASNQNVAQPGQIIKWSFNFSIPNQFTAGSYGQYVQPILEGTSNGYFPNNGIFWTITVPSSASVSYVETPSSAQMISGEPGNINLTINNNGNSVLASGATIDVPGTSEYQSPNWINGSEIEQINSNIAPGSSITISLPYLAPTVNFNTNTQFPINMLDSSNNSVYGSSYDLPVSIAAPVYTASYVTESQYPNLSYGQTANVYFEYKNTGNKPWYDDSSLSSATSRNALPTHLATANPMNRNSGFDYNWLFSDRPALNFSAVYNSDGSTLSSNQHVVEPGQIGEFSFSIAVDNGVQPGTYREFFQPIIEGSSGLINYQWTFVDITVNAPIYSATYCSQSSYPMLTQGSSSSVYFEYKNTGNIPWFDNNSYSMAPGGTSNIYPIHLGTSHPINRNSDFVSTGWYSASRPALNFSAVYNSDGSTLSSNQDIVQPGQIAKFSFSLTAPSNLPTGVYTEFFQPIAEGDSYSYFNDPWTFLNITVE